MESRVKRESGGKHGTARRATRFDPDTGYIDRAATADNRRQLRARADGISRPDPEDAPTSDETPPGVEPQD